MNPIDILMLTTEYPPQIWGGIGTHVFHLTEKLPRQEIAGTIMTLPCDDGGELRSGGFTAIRPYCPEPERFAGTYEWMMNVNLAWIHYLSETQNSFQAVHAHDWLTAGAALYLQKKYRLPLVATIHSLESGRKEKLITPSEKLIHSMERKLIQHADSLIVCSHYMKQQLLEAGANAGKVNVIPNGVPDFSPGESSPPVPGTYLFAMGRFVPEKGFQDLMHAFALIKTRFPTFRLVIAGRGPCMAEYQKLAEKLNIQDDVMFPGFIEGAVLDRYIQHASIACVPSTYEPFGIAALELMAAGRALIVSDAGGLPELVTHGKTGLVFKKGEGVQLAEAILTLAQDPQRAAALGIEARAAAEAYRWNGIAEKTSVLYKQLLQSM